DLIAEQRRLTSERHDLSADLRSLAGSRPVRAAAEACPPIRVEHPRMIPPVTIELGVEHGAVDKRPLPIRAEGTLIRPASVAVAHVYQSGPQRLIDDNLGSRIRPVRLQRLPERGLRRVAANRSWVVYSAC
nr:hypothetical protein [Actinomycetota bacterium]